MILKEPIVILANGAFPKSEIPLNILKKAKRFDIELSNADFEWIMK